jgi:lipocalin
MRTLALLTLLVVAVAADANLEKRQKAPLIKDFNIRNLEGKYYEIASTKELHKTFQKGCICSTVDFKLLEQNKLHVTLNCKNQTDNKMAKAEGTWTMIQPGAFRMEFIEKKSAPTIPAAAINQTEKKEVAKLGQQHGGAAAINASKPAVGGSGAAAGHLDEKKPAAGHLEEKKQPVSGAVKQDEKKPASGAAVHEEFDVAVLKMAEDNKHVLLAAPKLDAVWFLSRAKQLQQNVFTEFSNLAKNHGYNVEKIKTNQSC